MIGGGQNAPPLTDAMKYQLKIDSMRGPAGAIVDIDEQQGETIRILTANGIIGAPIQDGPEVKKVTAPEIKKRASHTKD